MVYPDPFPEKDNDDLVQIKVGHLRQLIRAENILVESIIGFGDQTQSELIDLLEEIGAMRENEGMS